MENEANYGQDKFSVVNLVEKIEIVVCLRRPRVGGVR